MTTGTARSTDTRAVSERPRARGLILGGLLFIAILIPLSAPAWTTDYGLLVGYQIAQLAALAVAWNLMAGYGGLVSLAVAAFVGIGSYASAKLTISANFPLLLSMLAGGLFASLFALIVSVPMFRFRGLYFTIASLVLASALAIFMVNYNGLGGASGLTLTNEAPTLRNLYFLALGCAGIAVLGTVMVLRARLGIGLLAVRDDEDVAERMGVATFRTKLVAFALSGFVMGLVGALQAQKLGHIEPYGSFALSWTIDTINAAIVGGIGTIVGPIVGAAIIIELAERLADYPEAHIAIAGALLIAVIRFAPRGVWGTLLLKLGKPLTDLLPPWLVPRSSGVALGAEPIERDEELPEASPRPKPVPSRDGKPIVKAVGVGKAFGGVKAVSDVDMEIRSGEVLGVVGPNGAGKSTLIGLLSGAHTTDTGSVDLFGEDVTALGAQARAHMGVGRTHQVPRPFSQLTVFENLMVAQMHGAGQSKSDAERETARILRRCGLAEVADAPASELGLLPLKRLEVARALALQPRLLLLDEVGAGLVESELRELIDLILGLRGEVESMLIVEHILDVIRECCDRLVVIDRGEKLVEGSPEEVFADPKVAAVYLGTSGGHAVEHARRPARNGGSPILEVRGVAASYGVFRALQEVSFELGEGEVLALLGTNGAGKTTTARAITGMVPTTAGEIHYRGKRIDGRPAHEIARLGIAHCMEGRQIFADLTVEENLLLGGRTASKGEAQRRLDEVYELFDILREKRGDSGVSLSGGQQGMLAIGRALMAGPDTIIFDEISLGLAPIACDRLYEALAEINARGVAMVVIEQNVERGLALADRVAVIEKGRVALAGDPHDVRRDPRLVRLYVGEATGATA
jgi:branched-chain amino acid transport system ATP-binding protein